VGRGAWAHGARELLAERKRVDAIMAHATKLAQPTDLKDFCGVTLALHEAFVDSHEARLRLFCRIKMHAQTHWGRDVVRLHLEGFPFGPHAATDWVQRETAWRETVSEYQQSLVLGQVTSIMPRLLEMQALCEELKPETLELVRRCGSREELERSMLMLRPAPRAGEILFSTANLRAKSGSRTAVA
jgi:hypothetical protein